MKIWFPSLRIIAVAIAASSAGCTQMQSGLTRSVPSAQATPFQPKAPSELASNESATTTAVTAAKPMEVRGQSPTSNNLNASSVSAPGSSNLPRYGMPPSGPAASVAQNPGGSYPTTGSYPSTGGYTTTQNQPSTGYAVTQGNGVGATTANGGFPGSNLNTGAGVTFQPPVPPPGAVPGAGTTVGNGLQGGTQPLPGANSIEPLAPGQPLNGQQIPGGLPSVGESFMDAGPNQYNQIPFNVYLSEARTGRFMFGMGVNSDAGVTGQIIIDERNFDITNVPLTVDDWFDNAFRGGGQGLRIEAIPGSEVQRYLVNFTEPYFLYTPFSLTVSGFFYDRVFDDWIEQRLGGRVGLGYRINHDLSLGTSLRMEKVNLRDPRLRGVPELEASLGDSELYSGQARLTHDTRDSPFAPTQGHFFEMTFEQAFGSNSFPKGEIDYRRYFLLRQRADYSGRHTLSLSGRFGVTGSQTPIYENYFAGGFSTIRGFDFRGASPVVNTVKVGGEMLFLSSAEYMFPLTADDMLKGVLFVDLGTVEESPKFNADNFRVAPGFGFRVSVPALGPAPLAFDFAFPVAKADTDDERIFSFFFGFGRM